MAKQSFITTKYEICMHDTALRPEKPFVVAFISDLHNAAFGKEQEALLCAIEQLHPSVVVSAGDLLTAKYGRCHMENAVILVEKLAQRYPLYLVNGNHETRMKENAAQYDDAYETYLTAVGKTSAVVLNNACSSISVNGVMLNIYGYEGKMRYYSRLHQRVPSAEQLRKSLGEPKSGEYNLLLAHHPDFFDAAAAWGADLMLAGHFHGGTVRVPLLGGLIGGSLRPFPKHTRGYYREQGKGLVVHAGLGVHTLKLRLFNPPELVGLHFS